MRIVGPDPHPWAVYHAEWCRFIGNAVVWVDDETLQWCQALMPLRVGRDGEIVTIVHQAKKILIIPASALIVINPLDDDADEAERLYSGQPEVIAQ